MGDPVTKIEDGDSPYHMPRDDRELLAFTEGYCGGMAMRLEHCAHNPEEVRKAATDLKRHHRNLVRHLERTRGGA